jgi:predicted nucleic acid-binding protein
MLRQPTTSRIAALGHGMDVATANPSHFERVPGLDVVPI